MIIIITGASHTGKTLLAQNLLERYKFPYLSMDQDGINKKWKYKSKCRR